MTDEVDQEWLKTPEGRAWLETDEGTEWFRSTEGQWWSQGADARQWYEELADRGWADYVSGKMPGPPEWGIRPEDAPRIGSRVRLRITEPTLGGTTFEEGELAIVTELHLMPIGSVRMLLRTLDGRKCMAMRTDDYEVA
jgi:hypothetical protein